MVPPQQNVKAQEYPKELLSSARASERSQNSQGNSALMISDIAGANADNMHEEDMDNLLKTGGFTKEMLLGQALQEEGHEEGEEEHQEEGQGEEEVIDIDNPDELAKRGLRRIQIEGENEEYLMDAENNIYDLGGNFIGTTDDTQNE